MRLAYARPHARARAYTHTGYPTGRTAISARAQAAAGPAFLRPSPRVNASAEQWTRPRSTTIHRATCQAQSRPDVALRAPTYARTRDASSADVQRTETEAGRAGCLLRAHTDGERGRARRARFRGAVMAWGCPHVQARPRRSCRFARLLSQPERQLPSRSARSGVRLPARRLPQHRPLAPCARPDSALATRRLSAVRPCSDGRAGPPLAGPRTPPRARRRRRRPPPSRSR